MTDPSLKWVMGALGHLKVPSVSKEYIRVRVYATQSGSVVNPTTEPCWFAFMALGTEPEFADYTSGSWETSGSTYFARCLIGPGAVVVNGPMRDVWTKIGDPGDTEQPAHRVGRLEIV